MNDGDAELDDALHVAQDAATQGSQLALEAFRSLDDSQLGFKGRRDLVTSADLEVESRVTKLLRAAFPSHAVLAEEEVSAARETVALGGGRDPAARGNAAATDLAPLEALLRRQRACWLVDPIDGTTNFAHGHPFFAISIALWVDARPAVAVVAAPALRETFTAVAGRGAHAEGRALAVSRTARIEDAMFATGFPYRRNQLSMLENNVEHWNRFVLDVRDTRRCGSAALDLAYVAAGRYDFYFERQLEPWDVAAGALLVREAGGRVSDYRGGENWLFGREILATNGHLHALVRQRLD
jgi:myo-inositol-1(or 4)-monophosphatase